MAKLSKAAIKRDSAKKAKRKGYRFETSHLENAKSPAKKALAKTLKYKKPTKGQSPIA